MNRRWPGPRAAACLIVLLSAACTPTTPTPPPQPATASDDPTSPGATREPTRTAVPPTAAATLHPTVEMTAEAPLDADIEREGLLMRLGKGAPWVMAASPDGQLLAVGSTLGVYLYRLDTLEEVWARPTSRQVSDLRFSEDGSQLYAGYGYSDAGLVIWDVASGESRGTFDTGGQTVYGISPDGSQVVTQDGSVRDLASGTSQPLPGNLGVVVEAAWSPDGAMLAASFENEVVVWSADLSTEIWREPFGSSYTLEWSPDSALLATNSTILPIAQPDRANILLEPYWYGYAAVWSPQPPWRIASITLDDFSNEMLTIWSIEDQAATVEASWPAPGARLVGSLLWSPDGGTIIGNSTLNGTIFQWDTRTGEAQRFLEHADYTESVDLSPDETLLASSTWSGHVNIWDMQTGDRLRRLEVGTGSIFSVAWSPDGSLLAASRDNRTVVVYDTAIWEEAHELIPSFEIHGSFVYTLAWSPDGSRLAADGGSTTYVWDVQSEQELFAAEGERPAWSPDGTRLATILNNQIFILDAATGEQLLALQNDADYLDAVAWLEGGAQIASRTRVWDATTGEVLSSVEMPYGVPSPDGRLIAGPGPSSERDVVVWDAQSGEALATLEGHPWRITEIEWSEDSATLVVGTEGGAIFVWDVTALAP